MGQHTWFEKDKQLYLKAEELNKKLHLFEEGLIYLDRLDEMVILKEIDSIDEENEAEYHDLFRTNKRKEDGSYIEEVLSSREECFKWIDDPDNLVSFKVTMFDTDEQEAKYKEHAIKLLNEFWDKYPDGCIYFG